MSRWKAAAIHLVLSLVIIAAVGIGLISLWYGWPLFELMGGLRLLTILAIVDIVIGPVLTLIVYKHGKKSLAFDLTVIALLQIGFLAYGLNIMAQSRPVFLVGLVDRFELVFANELDDADLAKGTTPEYRTRSWTGPRMVGGQLGQTAKERRDLALSGFAGKDIHMLPERYIPFAEVRADLLATAKPAAELAATSPQARARIEAVAKDVGKGIDALRYLPITARRARATMIIDAATGEPLAPIAVDPWPEPAPPAVK